jgi:hypothetical protein
VTLCLGVFVFFLKNIADGNLMLGIVFHFTLDNGHTK